MKISAFTLTAFLATTSISLVENGRTFFNDDSPENTYVAGQYKAISIHNNNQILQDHIGRTLFGGGSVENNDIRGHHPSGICISTQKFIDVGQNAFSDGSSLSN